MLIRCAITFAQYNRATDQRHCYCYIDSIITLLPLLFKACSHCRWLSSPVCVGPSRKPLKTGFLKTRLNYLKFYRKILFLVVGIFSEMRIEEIIINSLDFLCFKLKPDLPFVFSSLCL